MTTTTTAPGRNAEHTFLTPREVFDRYRWGRTKGYEMLKSPRFPRPVGGAYRLDTLQRWEDDQLAGVEARFVGTDPGSASPAAEPKAVQPVAAPMTTPEDTQNGPSASEAATPVTGSTGESWTPLTPRKARNRRRAA